MRNQIRNCEESRQLTVTLSSHAHVVLQNLHDGEATEKEQCKKSVAQLDEPKKVRGVRLLQRSEKNDDDHGQDDDHDDHDDADDDADDDEDADDV